MAVELYTSYDHHRHEEEDDDDYIDMEVTSFSNFYCQSHIKPTSPTLPTHDQLIRGDQFEFQMSLTSIGRDLNTTSPADELFYKGKLLPLHLPPRLQMVEKLLNSSSTSAPFCTTAKSKSTFEEIFSTPLNTSPLNGTTPFESCNVSPAESCQVSRELNIDEYIADYGSDELKTDQFINEDNGTCEAGAVGKKSSWTRKIKLMRQTSALGSKLKASRSYLKYWFSKSGCFDESSSSATGGVTKSKDIMIGGGLSSSGRVLQDHKQESLNKEVKKKFPFGQISQAVSNSVQDNNENKTNKSDGTIIKHRRSFSGAFTRRPSTGANKLSSSSSSSSSGSSSSSSSSSFSSNNSVNNSSDQLLPVYKRSSSASNSEFDSPIQSAIAYCKKSRFSSDRERQ